MYSFFMKVGKIKYQPSIIIIEGIIIIMNYYNEIKHQLLNNEITKKVKEYSKKLTLEFGKGYTESRLRYIRRFFEVFSKCPTLSDELTFSHYCEIIWLEDNQINYYVNIAKNQHLSIRELRLRVKNKEYERLSEETKNKIKAKKETKVQDFIKEPIIIKNNSNYEVISEKILQKIILEDIESFMKELGEGFTFIGSQYKIKIGNRYNYIDLLMFNYIYNCFIVIELKVTELKKEHIGQIEVYMNYIDSNLRTINQDKTIGIIISRKDNRLIMEYCSDKRILSKTYLLV